MLNLHLSICTLVVASFCIHSCKGQVKTNSGEGTTLATDQGPVIIGSASPETEPGLVSQYIRAIYQDKKGNYWFGPAGESVVRYDGDTLRYFSRNEFFQGNPRLDTDFRSSIYAITEDHAGNLWFGTDFGAVKYDGHVFRSYHEVHGLSDVTIGRKSILADRKGNLWVGTGGGVFRYLPSADTTQGKCFERFALLDPLIITDIIEDRAGNIWFATREDGVFRYDPSVKSQTVEHAITQFTHGEALGDNVAGGIVQDDAGHFWFTMKNGICRYDGKTFTDITSIEGFGGSEVWGICRETSGIIWISARGSTTRYDPSLDSSDPKAFTVFTPKDGINCCVQSMYQDRSGNMWWGAGSGIYQFDGERFYQVKQDGPWRTHPRPQPKAGRHSLQKRNSVQFYFDLKSNITPPTDLSFLQRGEKLRLTSPLPSFLYALCPLPFFLSLSLSLLITHPRPQPKAGRHSLQKGKVFQYFFQLQNNDSHVLN